MQRITIRSGRAGGVFGLIGCVWAAVFSAIVLICIGSIVIFVFGAMRSSEPYKMAVAEVQTNPQAERALGVPVEVGWYVAGSINTSGSSGNASLEIPVSGSRDRGTLYVEAYKSSAGWHFTRLELVTKGYVDRINLLEE